MAKDPSIQYLNKDFLKSKKVVIFDIETQELARHLNKATGKWEGAVNSKNAISVATARIYEGGKFQDILFHESDVHTLISHLKTADIVSGYNIRKFDLPVLSNYSDTDLTKLKNIVDIMDAVPLAKTGRVPKLDNLLGATLGIHKPQTGATAVDQWKAFLGGDLKAFEDLKKYALSDVQQTSGLFEHILSEKWVKVEGKRHKFHTKLAIPSERNQFRPRRAKVRASGGKGGGTTVPPTGNLGGLVGGSPHLKANNLRWLRAGLGDIDKLGLSRNSISTNLWNAFKGFEETWGGFGRTFELSPLTSMMSLRKAEIHIGYDDLKAFQNYYSKLVGRTLLESDFEKGLTFKAGSLFVGKDKVAGKFGAIQRYWKHPVEGHLGFHSRIAQSFQSALGIRPVGLNDPNRPSDFTSDARYLIYGGTKTNLGLGVKRAQAIGATLSKRYFKLLDDPLEFYSELFNTDLGSKLQGRSKFASNFYNKILRNRLGVGGKANELGGIGRLWLRHGGQLAKYIIGGSFLYHLVDNFAEDTLGFGIKEVGAKLYQGANLALSTLSYVTGLTAVRRIQEKYAPGSTDKGAYLAFPLSGAITGAFIAGMKNNIALTAKGPDALKSVYAREAIKGLPTKIPLIRNLIRGKQYTRVGRYSILGATIGALVAAPFLAGTVGHKYTPGELMDLYSGREEVAVRKSRFWEAGRCILPSSKIFTELNGYKLACEITTEDRLLTPNGFSNIMEIYQRCYNGEAIALYSAANRYVPTFVTPNHIIPSIKFVSSKIYTKQNHLEIREREAGELKVHDYVQIPIEKMDESLVEIDILDYLNQDTLILENNLVYCGQKNRFTDKIHKTKSLPLRRYINLDEDLGWLFGVFAAEGNISFGYSKPDRIRKPQFIETVHSIHELWIAEKIQFICEQKFGIEAKIKYRDNFTKAKEGAYIVRICNSLLARLFYGLLYDEISGDYDKSFTKLLKGPTVFKLALVQGYWDGDGHLDGEAKIISSARENLVLESQQILFNFGIFSSLSLETRDIGNENQSKKFKLRWVKNIPFEDGPRYFWDNGNLWAEIITIESLEFSGLVYDFEVEDESHLLQAGSFFIHNSPMRGGQIDYFRPHFSVTAQIRAQEKSLFDKGENFLFRAIKQTEILKDIVAPYYMEESHYGDRPYPIAVGKSYGLGPLSAVYNMTLAKLFKPPRYMHMAEWASEDGTLWGSGTEKASARAVVDYSKQVTSLPSGLLAESEDLAQRLSDAFGLIGFMGEAINENLTGRRVWLQQLTMLQPSSDMNSLQKSFWDLNIGGGLATSEAIRRLIPPKRAQNRYINNIPNEMPSWIPQRHYLDLHHGDPFGKIPEGELRLPGKGFEARYPELAGLSPEDYPLAYRVKILSDVAPFSAEFQALSKQGEMYASEMTGREKHVFSQAIKQAQQKKNERMFAEDPTNIYSWYFQTINYLGRLNPIEHLLPISPVHKFGGPVGAIEDYKLNMIYSKEFTSWAHPIESFIKPAMRVAAHDLGWQGIPGDIQDRREIQEYFDRLEYLQMMTLANRSEDGRTALSFSLAANKTLTGVNPFGPESTIYQALEGREEYYYAPFRDEMNPRRQAEILQYLPEQYKKIYRAIWTKRKAESGNRKAQKELALLLQSEGEDINEDLIAQYKASAHSRSLEGYADWKRMRDTQQFLAEHDFPVPPPNWAGFHRGVKMNDVKMRYVQNAGHDFHNFDLWESDQIGIESRPWGVAAADQLYNPDTRSLNSVDSDIRSMFTQLGFGNINVSVQEMRGFNRPSTIDMSFDHDRSKYVNPIAKYDY